MKKTLCIVLAVYASLGINAAIADAGNQTPAPTRLNGQVLFKKNSRGSLVPHEIELNHGGRNYYLGLKGDPRGDSLAIKGPSRIRNVVGKLFKRFQVPAEVLNVMGGKMQYPVFPSQMGDAEAHITAQDGSKLIWHQNGIMVQTQRGVRNP